jgi:Flp pilus assembly protein TadG
MKKRQQFFGQTLIEFALIFPLFILLIMGLFDVGRFVFFYSVLNNAVREGTRTGIVQTFPDYYTVTCDSASSTGDLAICTAIEGKFFDIGTLSDSTITITRDDNAYTFEETEYYSPTIEIVLQYNYQPITPGLGLISDFAITVDSTMLLAPIALGEWEG